MIVYHQVCFGHIYSSPSAANVDKYITVQIECIINSFFYCLFPIFNGYISHTRSKISALLSFWTNLNIYRLMTKHKQKGTAILIWVTYYLMSYYHWIFTSISAVWYEKMIEKNIYCLIFWPFLLFYVQIFDHTFIA